MASTGQTFTQGGRSAKVSDIKIYGKGILIGVETFLEGSFNGSVELLMKPKYVRRDEQFELNIEKVEGVFKKAPDRDEFASDINESLIVELYSR